MPFAAGRAKTGGRKKGARNKRTAAAAAAAAPPPFNALAFLAKVAATANDPTITPELRVRAAAVLAQYQYPRPVPLRQATGTPVDFPPPKSAQEARDMIAEVASKMAREEIDRDYASDVIASLKAYLDARAAELEAEVERHRIEETGGDP